MMRHVLLEARIRALMGLEGEIIRREGVDLPPAIRGLLEAATGLRDHSERELEELRRGRESWVADV